MLAHAFMRNAFLAGTAIALACGLVGYFVVLRGQVFTGDALSHVAFTGALAALALGIDVAARAVRGDVAGRGRPRRCSASAAAPTTSSSAASSRGSSASACSSSSIFTTVSAAPATGPPACSVLFGSIFGLEPPTSAFAVAVSLVAAPRPARRSRGRLLFASLDRRPPRAGVPVRRLGFGFLGSLGIVAAEATQAVGALLLLGLLAAPAGAARL